MASPQIVPDRHCHERFYFSDGSLHLLVEDTVYCVHRSLFEMHTNKFPVRGIDASFDDPYILSDVNQIDFDRFLACLYPHTLLVEKVKTSEEWTSILKLASKWGFESLRSRAIRKIKRTLNTAVDMVAFGRRYDIPDILLSGYATLSQTSVPLTYEEGLRLGMKDVVDIYRIRHELHGSGIMVISFEEATAKVKAFVANEGRKDDAEAGAAEQRDGDFDVEEAGVWSDVSSVSSSRAPSAEDDREPDAAISMVDTGLPLSKATMTRGSRYGHRSPTAPSRSKASGSQGRNSQLTLQEVPDMPPGLTTRGPELLDELTIDNFNDVSVKIFQWVNAIESQTLFHMTQLIVEKAINNPWQIDVCVHLCKEMATKVSGKKFLDTMTKKSKCTGIFSGPLFREHLGKVCQEKLESVTVSVTAADTNGDEINLESLQAAAPLLKVRRRRLIRFISKVSDFTSEIIISQAMVRKWITTLLDAKDEEKLVTLSMLLDSAGPRWDTSSRKLKTRMDSCFVKMTDIAKETNSARLRTLLQDVIERRNKGWVANETAQQGGGLAETRRAPCSSEDELANEQPKAKAVKTSKGDGERSSEKDVVVASSDKAQLDEGERSSERDVMVASSDKAQLDDDRDPFSSAPTSPFTFGVSTPFAPSVPLAPCGTLSNIGSAPTSSPLAPPAPCGTSLKTGSAPISPPLTPSDPCGTLFTIGSAPISSPNAPRHIKKLPTQRGAAKR